MVFIPGFTSNAFIRADPWNPWSIPSALFRIGSPPTWTRSQLRRGNRTNENRDYSERRPAAAPGPYHNEFPYIHRNKCRWIWTLFCDIGQRKMREGFTKIKVVLGSRPPRFHSRCRSLLVIVCKLVMQMNRCLRSTEEFTV